jgi:hypothetical protein
MARTLRLARLAVEAEGLRLKRQLRRLAIRASLGGIALVFLVSALACIHFAAWLALARVMPPAWAAMVLAGSDMVIALILAAVARSDLPDQVENEAMAARQAAVRTLSGQIATTVLISRSIRLARHLFRRGRPT